MPALFNFAFSQVLLKEMAKKYEKDFTHLFDQNVMLFFDKLLLLRILLVIVYLTFIYYISYWCNCMLINVTEFYHLMKW